MEPPENPTLAEHRMSKLSLAGHPLVRSAATLATVVAVYYALPLGRISAAKTLVADVHASGQLARTLVWIQIVFDVIFISAVVAAIGARVRGDGPSARRGGRGAEI